MNPKLITEGLAMLLDTAADQSDHTWQDDLPECGELPSSGDQTYVQFYGPVLQKGGAGSGDFGHAGRPGEVGGSMASGSVPTRPGSTPIPTGMIRGYHYTDNLDAVLKEGLTTNKARGSTYGEPNAIWMSTAQPRDEKEYVEVFVSPEEIGVGGPDLLGPRSEGVRRQKEIDRFNDLAHDFMVQMPHVAPDRFVTYSRPWHIHYRTLTEDAATRAAVVNGEYDYLLGMADYDTAVQTIKAEALHKGGAGSGDFGHAGRPGEVGGSTASGRQRTRGPKWTMPAIGGGEVQRFGGQPHGEVVGGEPWSSGGGPVDGTPEGQEKLPLAWETNASHPLAFRERPLPDTPEVAALNAAKDESVARAISAAEAESSEEFLSDAARSGTAGTESVENDEGSYGLVARERAADFTPPDAMVHDAQVDPLGTSPVKTYERNGGGSSASYIVKLEDGTKGVYKPIAGEAQDQRDTIIQDSMSLAEREVVSYAAAERIVPGLVPKTIMRTDLAHGPGSVQAWFPNSTNQGDDDDPTDDQEWKIAVLDVALGNTDRHGGNYMVGNDSASRVAAIDNGLVFPEISPSYTLGTQEFRSKPAAQLLRAGSPMPGPLRTEVLGRLQATDWDQFSTQYRLPPKEKQAFLNRIKWMTQHLTANDFARALGRIAYQDELVNFNSAGISSPFERPSSARFKSEP